MTTRSQYSNQIKFTGRKLQEKIIGVALDCSSTAAVGVHMQPGEWNKMRGQGVGSFPGKSSCATCHNTCAGMLQWTRATLHAVSINTTKELNIRHKQLRRGEL
jgi:hypothetical protein